MSVQIAIRQLAGPGRRFALLVGVSEFQDSQIPRLECTRNDVEALDKVLREGASFEKLTTLLDEDATREGILRATRKLLEELRPEDLLLLYFATHGVRIGDVSCLLAHDSVPIRGGGLPQNHISIADLVSDLPSMKTLFIVTDSCHQNGLWPEGGFSFPPVLSDNVAGLQSSRFNEASAEVPQLKHGVFSYYLLEGLRGQASRGSQNEITIFDLHRYVTRKVQDYTAGRQNPVLTYRGGEDFVIHKHPPTDEQQASKERSKQIEKLRSRMRASWRAKRWMEVLDRWDDLLQLISDNDAAYLAMALDARRDLDAKTEKTAPRYVHEPLDALGGYPRVWPCLVDTEAPQGNAVRTHPDVAVGDLLLALQIEGDVLIASGVYLAKTSSFPAIQMSGNPAGDEGAAGQGPRRRPVAHYAEGERKLDLHERFVDLEAESELRDTPIWRELVLDKLPLASLTCDLRSMRRRDGSDAGPTVWTAIRAQILADYPGEATQLFELELQPIRRTAAFLAQAATSLTRSEFSTLREVGLALIAEYLTTVADGEQSRRRALLLHLLDDAVRDVAPDIQAPSPAPIPPPRESSAVSDVRPSADSVARPISTPTPSVAPDVLRSDARASLPASPPILDVVPTAVLGARKGLVTPPVVDASSVPTTDSQASPDLRLTIAKGVRVLRDGARELWRRETPPFDWMTPLFSDARDPSKRRTLAEVKRELPRRDRESTERFGGELAVLLFGEPIHDDVINALAVDAGIRRRFVLELDGNAGEAPWEYLHINGGFILERRLSIVRQVDASGTNHSYPLTLQPPLAVVVFAYADPGGKTPAMNDHRERIHQALHCPVREVARCTPDDLAKALQTKAIDGFHFLGHGQRDDRDRPFLLVHAEKAVQVSTQLFADELARLLADSKARFVFLGACHSGETAPGYSGIAEAIVRASGIPVVAMQLAVPQDFSTGFAVTFYERLEKCGYDLERAVYEARQFQHEERHAFAIPVLFADVDKRPRPVPELSAPPAGAWASFAVIAVSQPGPPPEPEDQPLPTIDSATVIPHDDDELRIDWAVARAAFTELYGRYALPDDLLPRIASELAAGRHVVLTGPVGTGKTTIAGDLVRALGYRPYLATASAEWTTFEVVGGFFPHAVKDGAAQRIDYAFRPGVFVEAVRANWEERRRPGEPSHWHRRGTPDARGTWLVLDEINRADMDRALGGVFTALESLRLRIPVASMQSGSPATVEIPIPQDFRIIATMNGVDRHYLFRLSDALKRRFAFIEVGVSEQLADEWQKVVQRCQIDTDLDDGERELHEDLRRFAYLVRAFHPVGTAQLLAAVRFLHQSRPAGLSPDARLHQALAGSILPGLEEAPRELLGVLRRWCETRSPNELAAALQRVPALYIEEAGAAAHGVAPQLSVQLRSMMAQLEALAPDTAAVERAVDGEADDAALQRFTHRVVRRGGPAAMPRLGALLAAMTRS